MRKHGVLHFERDPDVHAKEKAMSNARITVLFVMFLLIVVPAHGEELDKEALTRELMEMSGLQEQLKQISQRMQRHASSRTLFSAYPSSTC